MQLLLDKFQDSFGHTADVSAIAPGRVNLIGEHTDYNDGFVFPAAIDRGLAIAASAVDGPSRVISAQLGEGTSFDTMSIEPGEIEDWAKYAAGMAWVLRGAGRPVPNIEVYLSSDIPIGSGVSSSAAIEMAFGVIWNHLGGLGLDNFNLALLGQSCENNFLGLKSGIMDQMASAMGKQDQAMFLDTRSLHIDYAPLPVGIRMVLLDTCKPRALTESAYNERRSQCEKAAAVLGVPALRDATIENLARHQHDLDEVVYRRARHVITENQRALEFKQALGQRDLALIGRLMRASHLSLRDDYEVSCEELDAMAEAATVSVGCVGARMMGAGFGGACIALVHSLNLNEFMEDTLASYRGATGKEGQALVCSAAAGAHIVP
jgi:galactokinase